MLEKPVRLVRKQTGAVRFYERHELREGFVVDCRAGGVVRKVDDDNARVRPQLTGDAIEIERPISWFEWHQRDLGANVARDLVQRLIRRPHDHGMIASL